MNFSKRILAAAFAALIIATAGYTQQVTTPDISAQAASVTEFDVNGLKVILRRRASAPTVAVGLFLRGGVRNLTDKTAGLESLMLTSAIEAGQSYPRQAVRRELARTGSTLSASAGSDFSVVSLASTRENFDRTWKLFADVTMKPLFDAADVNRVRDQMISSLREQETVPDSALDNLEDKVIYAGHPYSVDPTGTPETLTAITPAQLRDYHKKVMETSRLLLVVVGDVDAADLKARIASTLGTLPKGTYTETALPPLDFSKPSLDVVSRQLPTNYIKGDFAAPSLNSPDYYPMRVAMSILATRIFQEVRVKRQLSYAPNADMDNMGANTANIYVTAVDANQAVDVMLKEIQRIKGESINDEELSGAAGEFLTNYYLKQQTNAAQAGDLARYELIGGGWRNSFQFLNHIREVTPDAVRASANKYMKNIRFVVIGDPAAINKTLFTAAE
ncbi:MAG TPA: pitrilysin family protein [Pyrinomonadaceae bacterium]|nr:pitrilysin family protein [Pyrinomonadaceae bacterium]